MKKQLSCLLFYFKTIWKREKLLFLNIGISVLINTFASYVNIYFLKYLLDFLEAGKYTYSILWTLGCLMVMTLTANVASLLNIAASNAYFRINTYLRSQVLNISTSVRFEEVENPDVLNNFELAHKCVSQNILSNYTQVIISIVSSVFVIAGTVYISFGIKWWMSLLALGVTAVNTVCNILISKNEIERFQEETSVSKQLEYSRFWLTDISRAKEVRTYTLQRYIVGKLREYNDRFFASLQKFTRKRKKPYLVIEIINAVQLFAVYAFCAYQLFAEGIGAGDFMLYSSAVFTFGGALNSFTGSVIDFWKTNNLMTKLIGVLNIKKHLEKRTLFEDELKTIEFRNVSFSYNGSDENVLDNISFTIRSNEKFSLIGENGAGKSTLVKLLLGMYTPTKGAIYINGKRMDSEKYDYTPLFSAVFQDYKIFSFTVEDNIKMSEKELSEDEKEKIRALLDSMGMQSVDTASFVTQTFSDDGINFSGGETQKLAIVRALYKDAPIIVLDEPTSALSPQSEYEIYRSFNSLTENKTVLFISHRLSSCRICDKILLLHHGKLEAIGSHDELFGSNALYTEMFSSQAELFG